MPFADSQGCRIYYRLEGAAAKPLLVLAHALGTDHGMWDPQVPALLRYFRVLRVDLRGHGASDAPAGDYTMAQLGGDVLAAADAVGAERFSYCGLSLGGMIGQWLGVKAADRVERLVLANTSARVADPKLFEARRSTVLERGVGAIEESVMQRFFSARVRESGNPLVETIRWTLLATNAVGYAGCCAAIRDMDQRTLLREIAAPTLVIGGTLDISTPWAGHGEVLASGIGGAHAVQLAAAHLSNIERPSGFNDTLFDFLLPARARDRLSEGFAVRREVLGDAHVVRSMANATEWTRDFQELITRYAWGTIWTRPGLDVRTRRLLVLAMTASLGRWEEFRLHVHTGLAADLEATDIEEALLQVAIYAGVPAANSGFHIVTEEIGAAERKVV